MGKGRVSGKMSMCPIWKGTAYDLNGEKLHSSAMAVLVHDSRKASMQVMQVIRKANGMLLYIARRIEYTNRTLVETTRGIL